MDPNSKRDLRREEIKRIVASDEIVHAAQLGAIASVVIERWALEVLDRIVPDPDDESLADAAQRVVLPKLRGA
jgi:hypothetical protein